MGIFTRMADIVKANINDFLDKAEDPEKMIKQMVIEMEEAVNKATTAVGTAIANQKRLEKQFNENKKLADEWQNKAVQAVNAGRDDLASQALAKKNSYATAAASLEPTLQQATATAEQMKTQLQQLKAKLDEARVKQNTLIARHQAAKAKKMIAQQMSGIGGGAFGNFDKFEKKVEDVEAEADAHVELSGQNTSLEDEFKKLSTDTTVDSELAALKAQLGK
ncbi:MAG TPA: PspA/IM30 family protein [bacterium]|nr:PspA/IM30 family protein [bacterium]HMZ03996.1 PspA/IM30 family protein [bacterium]HNB56610.1 PspA/IM30 family protein [bacterium]HND77248.1 PspA/IM30 family protein [bacterium]HNE83348.1 PspA/IM30 family protein [bacterium]